MGQKSHRLTTIVGDNSKRIDGATTGTGAEGDVSVGATSTTLLVADTSRRMLIIQNKGASTLYVSLTGAAATTAHMKIIAGGHLLLEGKACLVNKITGIRDALTEKVYTFSA